MGAYLGHLEIPAADPDRAARFFRRVFGWRAEEVPWQGGRYLKLRAPEAPPQAAGAGLVAAGAAGFRRPLPVVHVAPGALGPCLEAVVEAGGSVEGPAEAVGAMGRFARFRDTEGHLWGLWEPAA